MELYQLRCFYEAAISEKITEAADKLNVSQPALSIAIKKLEEELGVQLFFRNGRRISLSSDGKAIIPYVNKILSYVREISRMCNDSESTLNSLIIRVKDAMPLVIEAASSFHQNNPSIRLQLISNDEESDAAADIIIDSTPSIPNNTDTTVLLEDFLIAVLPRITYPIVEAPLSVDFFYDNEFIGMSNNYSLTENIKYFCNKTGMTLNASIICTNTSSMRNLIANGTGISIVPSRSWLFQNIPALTLVPFELGPWKIFITARPTGFRNNTHIVESFISHLIEWFKKVA